MSDVRVFTLTIKTSDEIHNQLIALLKRLNIQYNIASQDPLSLQIPAYINNLSSLIIFFEEQKETIQGDLLFPDGQRFSLDEKGISNMRKELLQHITESSQPVQSETKDQWTPESVENIIRLVDTLAKEYLQFRREDSDAKITRLSKVAEHNRRLTYSLVFFLLALIGLMAALTIYNKVSGDALLFLAGTVTGYIITLIQGFVLSPIEETPQPVPT